MIKKNIIKSIVAIIILSFLCMFIYDHYKVETETKVKIVDSSNKKRILKNYYKDRDNNNYYLYKLDDVIIDYTDRVLELNKALDVKQITMDFIINSLDKEYSINNNKVSFYKNDELALVVCNKDGYNNYIFGPSDMEFIDSLCEEYPYIKEFSVNYELLDITDSKTTDLIYVTIRDINTKEAATVLIDSKYRQELKEDTNYKFIFRSNKETLDKKIEKIFLNNDLYKIEILNNE